MNAPSIRDLVSSAQGGDRHAFEQLVELYREQLDHHARLRVGAHLRPQVEVEDVVQETFSQALASIERFTWQGDGSFLRWLKGIAERRILRAAAGRRSPESLLVPEEAVLDREVSPSHGMRRDERFARLQQALDSLPAEYREVIVLARIEGLPIREVCERMGRTRDSVAHLLSRALVKLKEAFGDTESLHLPPRRLDAERSRKEGPDDG